MPEERRLLGGKLRALRFEQHLTRRELADRIGLAPNTILAIEHGADHVRLPNLDKLTAYYGTSVVRLLTPPAPSPVIDPRVLELNSDHLAIADAYRNARNAVRQAIERVLAPDLDERLLTLLGKLVSLPCERIEYLETVLEDSTEFIAFCAKLRPRVAHDSTVIPLIAKMLNMDNKYDPLPTASKPRSRSRATTIAAATPARR